MAEPSRSGWRGKPFAVWVVFGSLVYFGVGFLALVVPFLVAAPTALADPFVLTVIVFAAIFFLVGIATLSGKRWSLIASAAVSILFLALFGPFIVPTLGNPADPTFWFAISGVPALIVATVFSILLLLDARRGIERRRSLESAESFGGLFTAVVAGFVIGGVIVGSISGALVASILQSAGESPDILIVPNAASSATQNPFTPRTLTVRVGDTVVWYSGDTTVHTITSDTGVFDSGSLLPGGVFKFTFTQAGSFAYHCAPHPTMTGTVTVSP